MSVVIKSASNATIEYRLRGAKGLESVYVQPGRNIVSEEKYDKLSAHGGFKRDVNNDLITINTAGGVAKQAAKEPDFSYVEGLAGQEDGKDILKEYALAWDIKLSKKNTIEKMIEQFKEDYEGK